MLSCESCIKQDVCGKKGVVQTAFADLQLVPLYQTLTSAGIKLSARCEHFAPLNNSKVFRGE